VDKAISAAEANRHFSRILREVKQGDTYTVTSHGAPVAKIVPITADSAEQRRLAWETLMARLESQPAQNLGGWTREELYRR
jgi:prevent-host-death family protein